MGKYNYFLKQLQLKPTKFGFYFGWITEKKAQRNDVYQCIILSQKSSDSSSPPLSITIIEDYLNNYKVQCKCSHSRQFVETLKRI